MRRGLTLTLLGLLAFVVLLVATLPARVLLGRVPGVSATGSGGTVWSGHADALSVQGMSLGRVEWRLAVPALFLGRLDMDVKASPPGGRASARCVITLQQNVSCSRVVAALPLAALRLSSVPAGWTGRLSADLTQLQLERGWPVAARGRFEVLDVQRPAPSGLTSFGSFRIELPAASSSPQPGLVGALQDIGGPLDVLGTVRLAPDRTYVIEGRVAARPEAAPEIARAIEYLGLPDAQGRREFSLAGSL